MRGLVAPLGVDVEPLDAVEAHGGVAPAQVGPRRIRMRGDRAAAEPMDVVDDVARVAGERIRRGARVRSSATTWPPSVLISTASMHEDAVRGRRADRAGACRRRGR